MKKAFARSVYESLDRAKAARAQSPIHFYRANPGKAELFHQSDAQTRILLGGNSAGKSYAALGAEVANHVVEAMDSEGNSTGWAVHPYRKIKIPNVGWISSATEDVQKEPYGGTQSYVNEFIGHEIVGGTEDRGVWKEKRLRNGSRIVFKTMMSGPQAYRSATIDWLAVDEPHPRSVINEARMRLIRSQPMGSMWWALTPVSDPNKHTTVEMIRWLMQDLVRPALIRQKQGVPHNGVEVWHMHMKENARYIDYKGAMNAMSGMPDHEQHARSTGEYMNMTIGQGFSGRTIELLEDRTKEPQAEGHLAYDDRARFQEGYTYNPDFREGFVYRFWEFPVNGHEYIIGVDPGGVSDPTSATVIDVNHRGVVAEFHGWCDEVDLAKHLQVLGLYYNMAEIAVEVNNQGKVTVNSMFNGNREQGIIPYENLYFRSRPSDLKKGFDIPSRDPGWLTTGSANGGGTRDLAIGGIRMFLSKALLAPEGTTYIPSLYHLDELRHFNQDNRGKLQAEDGHLDDRVMSLGIALQVLKRRDGGWLDNTMDTTNTHKDFMKHTDTGELEINVDALEQGFWEGKKSPYYIA